MKPGFKVANELAQEIVEIARFIISAFDVGREVGEIQVRPSRRRTVLSYSDRTSCSSASKADSSWLKGTVSEAIRSPKFGQFSNRHFQLVLDVGGRRIESDLIGLSDGESAEGSHEERSKIAMHQSDPS